jgi:hypothetical protein
MLKMPNRIWFAGRVDGDVVAEFPPVTGITPDPVDVRRTPSNTTPPATPRITIPRYAACVVLAATVVHLIPEAANFPSAGRNFVGELATHRGRIPQ